MFDIALEVLGEAGLLKRDADAIRKDLYEFFGLRVKNVLSEQVRYDVVDAVLAAGYDDVLDTIHRGEAAKAEHDEVKVELFEQPEEQALYASWQEAHKQYIDAADSAKALAALSQLESSITAYFDHVMVMAKDEAVKQNRLAMLKGIASDLIQFADFSKLVWA